MKNKSECTNLETLIEEATIQVVQVFEPDIEAVAKFQAAFTKVVIDDALNGLANSKTDDGLFYGFTSAGNVATNNITSALIESGISPTGNLPEGRCFLFTAVPVNDTLKLQAMILKGKVAMNSEKVNFEKRK